MRLSEPRFRESVLPEDVAGVQGAQISESIIEGQRLDQLQNKQASLAKAQGSIMKLKADLDDAREIQSAFQEIEELKTYLVAFACGFVLEDAHRQMEK